MVEFQVTEYGGEAVDGLDATQTLSTNTLIQVTLALSAVATVRVPATVALFAGAVIVTQFLAAVAVGAGVGFGVGEGDGVGAAVAVADAWFWTFTLILNDAITLLLVL